MPNKTPDTSRSAADNNPGTSLAPGNSINTPHQPASVDDFISRLRAAFPELIFKSGPRFRFHPPRTIFYDPSADYFALQTLHELGHATIHQQSFTTDVERLKIERAAWDRAAQFCTQFGIDYDSDFVESLLDSYRDWLHAKSRCPRCSLTRYQTRDGRYHCPVCD